jgi:hypothetical protein
MCFPLIYALLRSVLAAAGKFLGYQETLLLTISLLGGWEAILRPVRQALDAAVPVFT